jgi:septal ring factor EnvC (AmiA/AmiB activator)
VPEVNPSTLTSVVVALLASPFLNFLLQWSRRRVDKDNTIVTASGDAVETVAEALTNVRKELNMVRSERDEDRLEVRELRVALDEQQRRHQEEMAELQRLHALEIKQLRVEHREQMRDLEQRLNGKP